MKMFLADRNNVHIENSVGDKVGFANLEELFFYTGIDLRTALDGQMVDYEPERQMHTWFDGVDTVVKSIPYADFEYLINDIAVYQERKADSYYGVDLPTALSLMIAEIIRKEDAEDAKPFEYPALSGVYYKVTDAILNTIQYCTVLGLADTDPLPVNDGKWDNYNGTVSTSMTFGELKDLYKTGYEIPAHNYAAMKTHVYQIMQLTTVEAVKDYDYSTGWR
jgi:hypothetical protein